MTVEVDGRRVEVALPTAAGVAEGKFVLGVKADGGLMLAFDPGAAMHADIGRRFRLRVLGGGYCRLEPERRQAWIWGASGQFGREPDRQLTRLALEAALPGFSVAEAD
jgi:hypothetical protein